ncbi:MAG: hypothetical protein QNJ89_05165 [Acidimicrobiia bacterium]|nr:hypothetical protein [Acidimicrobiia bacterium]
MIPVYAVVLVLGVVALLGWLVFGLAATSVDGKEGWNPEDRFGVSGRQVVAGLLGFGLGGMSASFAGWASGLAVLAAIGGVIVGLLSVRFLGVEDADEDAG